MTEATSDYLNQPLRSEEEARTILKFLKKDTCSTCAHWTEHLFGHGKHKSLQRGLCTVTEARTHVNYASDTCDYHNESPGKDAPDEWMEEHV